MITTKTYNKRADYCRYTPPRLASLPLSGRRLLGCWPVLGPLEDLVEEGQHDVVHLSRPLVHGAVPCLGQGEELQRRVVLAELDA